MFVKILITAILIVLVFVRIVRGQDAISTIVTGYSSPFGIILTTDGIIYFAEYGNNCIRKVQSGTVSVVAGVVSATGASSSDGTPATSAYLNGPPALFVTTSGVIYFTEYSGHQVRKITTSGTLATVAGTANTATFTGDGGPAVSATLSNPWGIWIDSSPGNIFITDAGNNKIRMINSAGIISSFAGTGTGSYSGDGGSALSATLYFPTGIWGDSSGLYIYFNDRYNYRVRRVTRSSGIINLFAGMGSSISTTPNDGGPATSAYFVQVSGVTLDTIGNVYLCDYSGHRIRKVDTSGIISTYAGTGTSGSSTDGTFATSALLNQPRMAVVDTSGILYFTDLGNGALKRIYSATPTTSPTYPPTRSPTRPPSIAPTLSPTVPPTLPPTFAPSLSPTFPPTFVPTISPTQSPTVSPTQVPTYSPTFSPSGQPTMQPSGQPSGQPTGQPSNQPTTQPSLQPIGRPSGQPTLQPSGQPTSQPTIQPSNHPTIQPSVHPTAQPFAQPSGQPSCQPTGQPSASPTRSPSSQPSCQPTVQPTVLPSKQPSCQPSRSPSSQPTYNPTAHPTRQPSGQPTVQPSCHPTRVPTAQPSSIPSSAPSNQPLSQPSTQPSVQPSGLPSGVPSTLPTNQPTNNPSSQPSCEPSGRPSSQPSSQPSRSPSTQPSTTPSAVPSSLPSIQPSSSPTIQPSGVPTIVPSTQPSTIPTCQPTCQPSSSPTMQPSRQPTTQPSASPTTQPSISPTIQPSAQPTRIPTSQPSSSPSTQPSGSPTNQPTNLPTSQPTNTPTIQPSLIPTGQPSGVPSIQPSSRPSSQPSNSPSNQPSSAPTVQPTSRPSVEPSRSPTAQPSDQPISHPSRQPTTQPSSSPTRSPSTQPSVQPTASPTTQPSCVPTSAPTKMISTRLCFSPPLMDPELISMDPSSAVIFMTHPKCLDLVVEVNIPLSSCGQAWSYYSVELLCDDASVDVCSSQQEYLLSLTSPDDLIIFRGEFLRSLIEDDLVIQVTICNYLNYCARQRIEVTLDGTTLFAPVVALADSVYRVIKRTQSLSLLSTFYVPECGGFQRTKAVKATWTCYDTSKEDVANACVSVSSDPSKFLVAQNSLNSGTTYNITFTALDTVTSRHTSETVVVKVEEIPLQIIVTPMGSQILRVGESLELDGSSSYDPNISHSNLAGSATLEFEWTCKSVNETDCTLLIQQDRSSKVIVSTTEATEVGNIYNIDVTARNEVSGRVATKSIEIVIVSPNDPKIAFTILESSLTDVDVNKQFSIPAMVQTPTDCTAGWTASKIVSTSEEIYYEEAIVNLQSLSLVPIQKIFLGSLLMDSVNLVLTASALEVGSKYSFVLQCGSSSNHVVLTTNAPPSDGILSLSPNWGVELSTIFYWYGKDWRDSDLPISYEFGFISPTTGTFLPIRDRAAIRRTQSKLPAGLFANEFVVQTMIRVYDSLDASTEKQLSVVVTELDRSDLAKAINSSLVLLSTQSKDEPLSSEQIQSMVIVAGSSLTKINCTLSPDCNSLNRESCGTLQDHICGNCLMGYFGNSGPSNLLCSDINSLKIAWSNCTINEDCGSTLYQCNEKTKLCEIKDQKSCSNSCHSHGHCVFRNKITQDVIEKCPLYSATCEAVCVCHTGYGGDSCDQSTVVAEANQQTRNQLLRSIDLVPLASMEEGDDAVTTSSLNRASILRSLLNVDASLSSLSIASNMTEELMSNLLSVDANEVVIDDLEDVVDVVDTLVSGTELGSFTLLEGLGDVAIRSHVIGANSSVIMSNSFRMITTSIGSNVSIVNVPLTEVETVTGLLNTQVVLSSNSSLVSSSLNLIQTYPSLWSINDVDGNNISYLSNAVSIRLSATESFYHQMRVKLPLMVNQSEAGSMLSLLDKGVVVFSTNCSRKDYTIESFICPGSNVTLINRCHGEVGQIISHCPLLQPTCHVPHVTNSEVNCSMVDIDMDYMICDCTFIALPSKRRRLASDSLVVNGATLLGITAYVGQDFANTFVASKTLSDIQSADQVMVVLSLFISVWVLGGILIGYMHWTKNYSHRKKVKAVKGLKELFRHAGVAQELDAEIGAYSPEAAVRLLSNYLATIIPRAFSNKSILARMKEELMRHHPYLRLFNVKQSDCSPMLTTIQMVTVQSLMMFVLAMLYDLQCPDDDGTCREHLDKVSCLKRKSLFDSTQTYCNWNEEAITGTCEYADPVFSLAVGIYCAVLISVVTATINWPIDYLFTMLSAPIKDTLQAQIAAAQMVARARRASVSSLTGPTVVNSGRRRAAAFAAAPTPSIPPASLSSTQTKQASGVESGKNCHKKKKVKTVNGMHNASSRLEVKFIPEQIIDAHDVAKSALRQQIQEIVVNNKAEHISTEGVLDIVYAYRERLLSREKELGMEAGQQISEWIDKFTEQWGISAITGRIYEFNVPRHKNPYWAQGDTVMDLISNSLTIVEDIANEEAQFLRQVPESHAGLELIQLFIQDLLGQDTVAARIFSAKVNEDYKSFPAVSRGGKIIAAVCVVAVNLLFAYYTMLKGYVKGRAWQRSFLVACLVQFVVEILLFTTVECLYFNCFVPSLVTNEMHKIQRVLRETIHSIAFSGSNSFSNDVLMDGKKLSLNAPDHFFVSTKVAKCFPTMLESVLILSYRSVLPGEISQKWKSAYHWSAAFEAKYNGASDIKIRPHNDSGLLRLDHSHASNRSWAGFIQWSIMTFFMTLTMMLAYIVAFIPFSVQRAVIRFVQPFMLGGLALAWMYIVASPIYLSLFSVVVSLIVLFLIGQHCFYRYHRSFNKRSDAIRGVITPLALSTVKLDADDSYSSSEDGKDDNGKHDHRALHEREQLHRESQPQKPSREIIGETKIDLSKNAKVLLSNIDEISGSYSASSLQLTSDDETTKKLSKDSLSNASPQGSKSDTISKSYGDGSQKALTPSERSFDNKNVEQNEKDSQSSSSVSCSESSESDSSDEDHHRRDHHRSSKR